VGKAFPGGDPAAGDARVRAFLAEREGAVVARRGELVDALTRPALAPRTAAD